MEAVVEINPLGGAGTYQGWKDVTNFLMRGTKLTQRAERTEWNYGVVRFGDARLRLADTFGRWAPPFFAGSDFAIGGQDNSLVRVRFPSVRGGDADTIIWRGIITSKSSMMGWRKGESVLEARPNNSVYSESFIAPGNIQQGDNVDAVIEAIYNVAKVDAQVGSHQEDIQPIRFATLVVADEEEILGDDFEVLGVFEKILQPTDALTSYDMANNRALIFTRGTLPTGYSEVVLNRVIDILDFGAGTEQVYNELVINTGLEGDDETITERDEPSINQYGLRSTEIDLGWVRSRDVSFGVAQYLLRRLKNPRQYIKLTLDAWALPPASVFVGQHVRLNLFQNTRSRTGWGQGRIRFASNRMPSFTGLWYIETVDWLLDDDVVTITLREVR